MSLTLFEALEEIGVEFGMGGGDSFDGVDIDFMYSEPSIPGVAVAAVFTVIGDYSPDLLRVAKEWLEDGHVQMYDMSEVAAKQAVEHVTASVGTHIAEGITAQCLGTTKEDNVWTFLAYTHTDDKHQLWAGMGAQQLDIEKVKEMAQKFAVTHELKQLARVTH